MRPTWPITGISHSTIARIVAAIRRPPSSFTAWQFVSLRTRPAESDRLPRRDLVGEERQVGHDQGAARGPGDHLGVVDDLVERDPQRRLPTLDGGAQRVADQQAVDAGGVEQPGRREVVGGQHG